MFLVQRIYLSNNGNIDLRIINHKYKSMVELEQAMKKHPEQFNADEEYSLIEARPFLKTVTKTVSNIVQSEIKFEA